MRLYKLTNSTYQTHNGAATWGKGITNSVTCRVDKPQLCTNEVIHAYRNPNLALLLNPIHASIDKPVLWEAEGEVIVEDWGKTGGYELTTTKRLPLPEWYKKKTLRKRVQILFAILCAESVLKFYEDKHPQDDRPRKAIKAAKEYLKHPNKKAADAADAAAYAAADAAAYAAAYVAARAAARAAAYAARAAAYAADAAAYAADAVADAAYAARAAPDFGKLADRAVRMIMKEVIAKDK